MCTLPPKLDCGSLIALALLRTDPDNNCFKIQANFELSYCLASALKKGGVSFLTLCYIIEILFYSVQWYHPTASTKHDF